MPNATPVERAGAALGMVAALVSSSVAVHAEPRRNVSRPDVLLVDAAAAHAEWTFWLAGGAVFPNDASARATAALGGELSFGLLDYGGFPSGHHARAYDAELRAGPWLSGGVRDGAGLFGEGGLIAHLGAVRFARWGTFDLRAGAGYAEFEPGSAPYLTGAVGWGVRTVPGRERRRGYGDPVPAPRTVAEATVFRLSLQHRLALADSRASELVLLLELSPTFFLPPALCEHFVVY